MGTNLWLAQVLNLGKYLNAIQNGVCWLLTLGILKGENPRANTTKCRKIGKIKDASANTVPKVVIGQRPKRSYEP